LQRK